MTVIFSPEARAACANAVCDMMRGGALEIGTADMGTVLAQIALPPGECGCVGTAIECAPQAGTYAKVDGRAATARVMDQNGKPILSGLTVGTKGTDAILDHVEIKRGQIVTVAKMRFPFS